MAAARLTRNGRDDDAERLWRSAVAAGVPFARSGLAGALAERGQLSEAEQVPRDALAAGEPDGWMVLVTVLAHIDRDEVLSGSTRANSNRTTSPNPDHD